MIENNQQGEARYLLSGEIDELRELMRRVQVRVLKYGEEPSPASWLFMMGFLYGKEAQRERPEQDFREQMDEAVEIRDKLIALHLHDETK